MPTLSLEESLEALLDAKKKDVKTDSYPMSLGEITSMYQKDELVLHPEYQRFFRWTDVQKSKLIESILIGLPLPSFFLAQDENGNWEVVDGMQRLSTILDFMGELKNENTQADNYSRFECLTDELFYLDTFGGKKWTDLSRRIQLDFKRTKIQLIVLLRETSQDSKFELFQRLNEGGTRISGQELRNAILAGDNKFFLEWLEELAKYRSFVEVTGLSQSDLDVRYDMELVLRFIIFLSPYSSELKKFKSIDVYITNIMRKMIEEPDFDYDAITTTFHETFDLILEIGGSGALRFKDVPRVGKFSIAFFEAVALGIAQNLGKLPGKRELKKRFNEIGKETKYRSASGSGKNANTRIQKLLEFGKLYFNKS